MSLLINKIKEINFILGAYNILMKNICSLSSFFKCNFPLTKRASISDTCISVVEILALLLYLMSCDS